jgi:hypothetical protein
MNLTDVSPVKNCDGDFPLAGVVLNSNSLTEATQLPVAFSGSNPHNHA